MVLKRTVSTNTKTGPTAAYEVAEDQNSSKTKATAVVPVDQTAEAGGNGGDTSAGGSNSDGIKEPTPSTSAENVVDGNQVPPPASESKPQVEV